MRRRSNRTRLLVLAWAALPLGACAAAKDAAREPSSAKAQASKDDAPTSPKPYGGPAPPQAQGGQPSGGYPVEEAVAPAPPPAPPVQAPGTKKTTTTPRAENAPGATDRAATLASAGDELERARRELDRAGRECTTACRALGSMDRAAGRICEMAARSEETRRCEDARHTLMKARDQVRTSCGSCPGGPSVDASAPIPSVR